MTGFEPMTLGFGRPPVALLACTITYLLYTRTYLRLQKPGANINKIPDQKQEVHQYAIGVCVKK